MKTIGQKFKKNKSMATTIQFKFLQVASAYSNDSLLDEYRVPGYIIFDKSRGTITVVKEATVAPSLSGYTEYGGGLKTVGLTGNTGEILVFTDTFGKQLSVDLSRFALDTEVESLESTLNTYIETVEGLAGDVSQLEQDVLQRYTKTETDTEISNAMQEVVDNLPEYTVEKYSTPEDGYAATYQLKKDDAYVGAKINIPKDMVVQSGSVVVNPEGMDEGTYIKLVLANATNDTLYILVTDLVDVYTGSTYITVTDGVISLNTGTVVPYLSNTFVSKAGLSDILGGTGETTKGNIVIYGEDNSNAIPTIADSGIAISTALNNDSAQVPTSAAVYSALCWNTLE